MSPISSDTIMIRFSFRTTRPSDTVPIIGSGFHQALHTDTPNVDNPHARLMALPLVAIVGRPNVGKSALFNRILGERRAIVDPMAGLTRDRLYAESEWQGRKFVIVDTAGLVLGKDRDEVPAQRELRRRMEEQSRLAIEEADLVLFVLDVREGLTAVDRDIAELLRRSRTPVLVVANKADGRGREVLASEFYELGIGDPWVISALHGTGSGDLLDAVVEQYSLLRGLRAMERADIGIVVIDAKDGLTAQDAHIAGYVVEAGRGLVLVLNKWDLLSPEEKEEKVWRKKVKEALAFAPWAPISYVSAKTGQRVAQPLEVALKVVEERRRRIATPELNRWLRTILGKREPPTRKGKRLKVLYATQAEATTPTFVFFVNDPELVHFSYRRYLETQLRQAFGFEGTPIRMVFRKRGEET